MVFVPSCARAQGAESTKAATAMRTCAGSELGRVICFDRITPPGSVRGGILISGSGLVATRLAPEHGLRPSRRGQRQARMATGAPGGSRRIPIRYGGEVRPGADPYSQDEPQGSRSLGGGPATARNGAPAGLRALRGQSNSSFLLIKGARFEAEDGNRPLLVGRAYMIDDKLVRCRVVVGRSERIARRRRDCLSAQPRRASMGGRSEFGA